MIKERAMELVAALRSGEYEQKQNQLKGKLKKRGPDGILRPATVGFCCLGVACDISGLHEWTGVNGEYYDDSHGALPLSVCAYFGFKNGTGKFGFKFRPPGSAMSYTSLVQMNDGGRSFSEIADFIETYWEHL